MSVPEDQRVANVNAAVDDIVGTGTAARLRGEQSQMDIVQTVAVRPIAVAEDALVRFCRQYRERIARRMS